MRCSLKDARSGGLSASCPLLGSLCMKTIVGSMLVDAGSSYRRPASVASFGCDLGASDWSSGQTGLKSGTVHSGLGGRWRPVSVGSMGSSSFARYRL